MNRLSTRDILLIIGISFPSNDLACVLCRDMGESLDHSFLLCRISIFVWKEVAGWIDFEDYETNFFMDNF